jgi:hypothetical protein
MQIDDGTAADCQENIFHRSNVKSYRGHTKGEEIFYAN